MKKKLFSVMLVAALATSLLAGCGKNKKAEVDNTEVETSKVESTEKITKEAVATLKGDGITITGLLGQSKSVEKAEMSTGDEYTQISEYLADTDTTYVCYDVTTKDTNGNEVIPAGELTITIDIPDELKNAAGDTYIVFHSEDGTFKKLECTEKDGKITFKANTTGVYTICKYDSTNEETTNKVAEVETEEIIEMGQEIKVIKSDEVTTENTESTSNNNQSDSNNAGQENVASNDNTSSNTTTQEPAQQPAQEAPAQDNNTTDSGSSTPSVPSYDWNSNNNYEVPSSVPSDYYSILGYDFYDSYVQLAHKNGHPFPTSSTYANIQSFDPTVYFTKEYLGDNFNVLDIVDGDYLFGSSDDNPLTWPSQIPMGKYVNWNGKIGFFSEIGVTDRNSLVTTDMNASLQKHDGKVGTIQFGHGWTNGNNIYFEYITP